MLGHLRRYPQGEGMIQSGDGNVDVPAFLETAASLTAIVEVLAKVLIENGLMTKEEFDHRYVAELAVVDRAFAQAMDAKDDS
jgi:hypothetical protein